MSLALPSASLRSLTFNYLSSVDDKAADAEQQRRSAAFKSTPNYPSSSRPFNLLFLLLLPSFCSSLSFLIHNGSSLDSSSSSFSSLLLFPLPGFYSSSSRPLLFLSFVLFFAEHQITLSEALFDFSALRAFILNVDHVLSVISHFLPSSSSPDEACL